MLISFSGCDGAGKTTQIQLLLDYYQNKGLKTSSIYNLTPTIRYHSYHDLKGYYDYLQNYDVIHLRFRLNSDENNEIMQVLEFSDFNIPYLAELSALRGFYDYYLLEKYVTTPLLACNKTIISDRHYYDEVAFKTIYGCQYSKLLKLYDEIVKPDIAFYLSVPSETIFERNRIRKDGKTTLYKHMHLVKNLNGFFERLLSDTNLISINGEQPISAVHKEIISYLEP